MDIEMSMPRRAGIAAVVAAVLGIVPATASAADGEGAGKGGVEHVSQHAKVKTPKGKKWQGLDEAPAAAAVAAAGVSPPVGTVKAWPAVNYVTNVPFLTNFTLKGVGDHVEVWVQNNQTFPAG